MPIIQEKVLKYFEKKTKNYFGKLYPNAVQT